MKDDAGGKSALSVGLGARTQAALSEIEEAAFLGSPWNSFHTQECKNTTPFGGACTNQRCPARNGDSFKSRLLRAIAEDLADAMALASNAPSERPAGPLK